MPRFDKILVPVDLSPHDDDSLTFAAALAVSQNGRMLLAHFVRSLDGVPPARQKVEEIARRQAVPCDVIVESGDALKGILAVAAREAVDLIAMSTHGRIGLARAVMGSVAEGVVRQASCPVIVARKGAAGERPVSRILAPTDFSAMSVSAVEFAADLARSFDARLELLHVVEDSQLGGGLLGREDSESEGDEEVLAIHDQLRALAEGLGSPCGAVVTFGTPRSAIPEVAHEHQADLIVLSTHGRTGLARLLMGSTAESVVRTAQCSVLTLRRPGPGGVVSDEALATSDSVG